MKNPRLRTDGYYRSGPTLWEDWHAGVRMRETQYDFWRFFRNGEWVRCYRYEPEFAFWEFTQALKRNEIESRKQGECRLVEGGLPLFDVGTFRVVETTLTIRFEWQVPLFPTGTQTFESEMQWFVLKDRLRKRDGDEAADLYFTPRS